MTNNTLALVAVAAPTYTGGQSVPPSMATDAGIRVHITNASEGTTVLIPNGNQYRHHNTSGGG